jgi:hypothetical protein
MEASRAARIAVTSPALAVPDAETARRQAERILSEDRFHEPEVPRPFRGVLEWIGERLEPLRDALARVADAVPGGRAGVWVIVASLVLIASALAVTKLAARRARLVMEPRRYNGRRGRDEDPAALERAGAEAERRGDFDAAVRLRFRAGLLRLDGAHVIEWRPSLTSGGVARAIRSPAFDELAASFDAIAYGGRRAETTDVELARRKWPHVLQEVRSR